MVELKSWRFGDVEYSFCKREDVLLWMAKKKRICLVCRMSGDLEGEKKETPQLKIKRSLELGEFATVAYAKFSKWSYWPSIKKTPKCERYFLLEEIVQSGDIFCWYWLVLWPWDWAKETAVKANTWISFTFQPPLVICFTFIAITPRFRVVVPVKVPSLSQIELY